MRAPSVTRAAPARPLADPYRLVSITAVAAPRGAAGSGWHRYEIVQGANTIIGYREGAAENVAVAVEAIVAQLNARRIHQQGRVHLTLPPTKKARS